MTPADEPDLDFETELKLAEAALRNGHPDESAQIARSILTSHPDNIRALYLLAVSLRYQQCYKDALDTLSSITQLQPTYGRAYQEQGHNHRQINEPSRARDAFKKALQHNPALIASWRELLKLYAAEKDEPGMYHAASELKRLVALPKELVVITSMIHENKLYQAEQLCRNYLSHHPQNVDAMCLLAMIAVKLSIFDDAEFLLESAVEFAPEDWRARSDYVSVLNKRQKYQLARDQALVLRKSQPGNVAFETAYANQCIALGEFSEALSIYDKITKAYPHLDTANLVRGHALKTIGRLDEGIDAYRAAYKARADYGDAYWSLANLKTYKFLDPELGQMKAGFEAPETALTDRFHLAFALGKAYEDRENFPLAFDYYSKGNELKKIEVRSDPSLTEAAMQRQMDVCSQGFFDARKDYGAQHPDPIFIVGLPRAGSTLLEQILASHSQVDGTMELPNIIALSRQLNGRGFLSAEPEYPKVLTELSPEIYKKMGVKYILETKIHRQSAPFFIDKMPNNFLHIGLIHLILPHAKIIDARRHPMGCCFSSFKQLFADGQEFTYGLKDIGTYYKNYVNLMRHWDRVLPGKVLRVQYEDVVTDLEPQVRRILEHCNLPFDPACLEFYNTERSVRTPSSEQVRQPIYKKGMEQWRSFEPHLDPLKEALGSALTDYKL